MPEKNQRVQQNVRLKEICASLMPAWFKERWLDILMTLMKSGSLRVNYMKKEYLNMNSEPFKVKPCDIKAAKLLILCTTLIFVISGLFIF